MFLAVRRSWADHYVAHHGSRVDAASSAEEGDHRRSKATSHKGIDLRQPITLKLADDSSPAFLGL
jgi:hypothetical protein